MLPLKHVVTKHKFKFKPLFSPNSIFHQFSSFSSHPPPFSITQKEFASNFKSWFQFQRPPVDPLLLRIYQILKDDEFSDSLSALSLPLSQPFVLRVLRHGGYNNDILSCLKFFDWAGRQPHYYHTQATFVAIFRIFSRAKLVPLILDFLDTFRRRVFSHRVRFNDTLVVGYAIAGKPEVALYLFGKMRFQGLDLDAYAYHILLNALAEDDYFNAFDVVLNQIRVRGYATRVTDALVVKSLCKKGRMDEAEDYVNCLLGSGKELLVSEVSLLVGSLYVGNRFEHAVELVKEFGNSGMEHAYGVCVKGLVKVGKLDEALEFFKEKRDSEGYVLSSIRYNMLLCRLLRENRLKEVYDLLIDMNEYCIQPDMVTKNAILCFFCKFGMVDVALQLYNSRSQFGLNPNQMAYKYLILTLCWDGSVNEAYSVLQSSIGKGFFPDKQTFSTLVDALCRVCKVDEMKELIHLAVERKITPNRKTYDKLILALCRVGRVEDGYLLHGDLDTTATKQSYSMMIKGFIESNRGDIAARLLVEMNENGLNITRSTCRDVICSLLNMDNPRSRVINLLEMLTRGKPIITIYNFFIDGAGHANNAELARDVYEMMLRTNIVPTGISRALVLKSYMKSGKIVDALNFFNSLWNQGLVSTQLYNSMIIGLCKSKKFDIAHDFMFEMLNAGLNPSIESYESLVRSLCTLQRYPEAINLVQVYIKMGRQLTSFLGNTLLFHSLKSPDMYTACVQLKGEKDRENSPISLLSHFIGVFSGCRRVVNHSIEDLEELIKMCFPLDIFTYNLLLKRVTNYDMDQACELFNRIRKMGYEPNAWTYGVMVNGFSNHGRNDEANQWIDEMHKKGFYPTVNTRRNVPKRTLSNTEY